jgi:hypothetical protein
MRGSGRMFRDDVPFMRCNDKALGVVFERYELARVERFDGRAAAAANVPVIPEQANF